MSSDANPSPGGAPLYEILVIEAGGRTRARKLTESLREALAVFGLDERWVAISEPAGVPTPAGPGHPVHRCAVLLAAPDTQPAPDRIVQLDALVAADVPVLPVVHDLKRCGEVLPEFLGKFNALEWPEPAPGTPKPTRPPPAQAVLRFAGLSESDRRVFISYRRTESTAVAEQLFSALTRRGFNVFLDRYSIDAGLEFQAELKAELASRAMIVLLETAGLQDSEWVMEEIHYVRRHRLGLLAVTWPASRLPANRRILELPTDYRFPLDDADFPLAGTDQPLAESALARVVEEIERAHAAAMALRRRELIGSLTQALRQHGVGFHHTDAWSVLASPNVAGTSIHIAVVPRPATADSLYDCDVQRSTQGASSACLIQPVTGLQGRQSEMIRWLTQNRPVECAFETEIAAIAEDLATR